MAANSEPLSRILRIDQDAEIDYFFAVETRGMIHADGLFPGPVSRIECGN